MKYCADFPFPFMSCNWLCLADHQHSLTLHFRWKSMQLKKLVRLHVVLHTLATLMRSMYVT